MLSLTHLGSQGILAGLLAPSLDTGQQDTTGSMGTIMLYADLPLLTVYFAILFSQEHRGRMGWLVVCIALVSCILRGGRGAIFILLTSLLCVRLIDRKKETILAALKVARWAILLFVILFTGLMVVEKNTTRVQTDLITFAANSTVQYVVGPISALDYVLMNRSNYIGIPNYTFRDFLKPASWVGLISYKPPPILDEWVYVPFGTNVYTFYKPYITDFGIYGALGIVTIIGFTHTLLFRYAHLCGRLAVYIFALTVYSLFMVIFADVYTAFLYYIKGMLFGIMYLLLRRIRWSFVKEPTSNPAGPYVDGEISHL
jgi:oligosaccharide repeat unit polymerase